MADLEPRLTEVCAFLGVPFSPAMLDYHRDTTYGPPDPRIAEQWRRKASRREIALLEAKCGDMIAALGYASGGTPHHPGPARARGSVAAQPSRPLAHGDPPVRPAAARRAKLTRILGPRRLHLHFRRRMDARIARTLK